MPTASLPLLVVLAAVLGISSLIVADPCTPKQLEVFQPIQEHVQLCESATGLSIQIPPAYTFSGLQKKVVCESKPCLQMIGAIDDLHLPRCETLFANRNMTIQDSLDKVTSVCDKQRPAPSPMAKKKRSSSLSSSSSGHKKSKNEAISDASSTKSLVMTMAIAMSSIILLSV